MAIHDTALLHTPPEYSNRAVAPEYEVRGSDPVLAGELGRACGVGPAVGQILLHLGIRDSTDALRFLEPRLADLSSPDAMLDRDVAAERLARACRAGERVVVFGDYDVDGSTSCAILSDVLERLGADVVSRVANRFEGGYGFSAPALVRCLDAAPSLIVTCDCGSSDHPRIADARRAGVDVIVVDHHLVPTEALPANAFLNPHRPECGFPYKGMCSAGLAFSLSAALRARLGIALDLRPWLDLVALGTVADVAPLDGDNRILTRAGLRVLGARDARPGVRALRDIAGLRPGVPLGAHEIAFRLAPRLNAPGRLGDPAVTLALLRAKTDEEARGLAVRIEALNDERKAIQRQMTEEAFEQVESMYGGSPQHGIVVASSAWHRGVVGITAARLVDRYQVPVVAVALDGEHGHGSARTPEGFHLYDALSKCRGDLERFGGHAAAAGATLRVEALGRFRDSFANAASAISSAASTTRVDVEIGTRFPLPSASDLMHLEPLGEGNPAPSFALRDVAVDDVRVVGSGEHLKLRLRVGRHRVSAFGREMAHRAQGLPERVTAVGQLRPDLWRGGDNVELSITRLFGE